MSAADETPESLRALAVLPLQLLGQPQAEQLQLARLHNLRAAKGCGRPRSRVGAEAGRGARVWGGERTCAQAASYARCFSSSSRCQLSQRPWK